jgi:WD40 repeat protein/CHAT domain-containing protein
MNPRLIPDDFFDPYHQWLGIPKDDRPPTRYQLLGISPRERSSEVIRAAAQRQIKFVSRFRSGKYAELAARIVEEIERARDYLLSRRLGKDNDEKPAEIRAARPKKRKGPVPHAPQDSTGASTLPRRFALIPGLLAAFLMLTVLTLVAPWRAVFLTRTGQQTEAVASKVAASNAPTAVGDARPISQRQAKEPSAKAHRLAASEEGHTRPVSSVAFSPDGVRFASGSWDKTVKVWDTATQEVMQTLQGHTGSVNSVGFSPDGTYIVSGSTDRTLKLWDAAKGQERLTLKGHHAPVVSVAFSPDSTRIVSGSEDGTAKVWNVDDAHELLTIKGDGSWVLCVAFSPDGKHIVGGCLGAGVKVWDAVTGQPIYIFPGKSKAATSVAFSPNGKQIVSGNRDGTLELWSPWSIPENREPPQPRVIVGHSGPVCGVAFSPDGKQIVSGGRDAKDTFSAEGLRILSGKAADGTLKLWDAVTGGLIHTFSGQPNAVTSVAFSPDGKRVVAGSVNSTVSVSGLEERGAEDQLEPVRSVAFSPDGRRIASACLNGVIETWDSATGQQLLKIQSRPRRWPAVVAFSPDGTQIASTDGDESLKVWDAANGREKVALSGHSGAITSFAFSPDGKWIVTGSADQTLKVWDAASGQAILTRTIDSLRYNGSVPASVAVSPDGRRIISGQGYTVKVWDAANGTELYTSKHGDPVIFSPDGERALVGGGNVLTVLNAENGADLFTLDTRAPAAFSPDGKRIVSGEQDGTLAIWNAATGRKMLTLKGHTRPIVSIAFGPDGTRIVSGGEDGTLRLWDATTTGSQHEASELIARAQIGPFVCVAISADGSRVVTGRENGALRVWDAATVRAILTHDRAKGDVTLMRHQAPVCALALSANGKRIVSGNSFWGRQHGSSVEPIVNVWETATERESLMEENGAKQVKFTDDGEHIYVRLKNGSHQAQFCASEPTMLAMKLDSSPAHRLAISPDGMRIITPGKDTAYKVWDVATGRETLSLDGKVHVGWAVTNFVLDPKQNIDSGTPTFRKSRRASSTPKPQQKYLQVFGGTVANETTFMSFSPDGKRVIRGDIRGNLQIWDAADGRELLTFRADAEPLTSVAVSRDGKRIATGGTDVKVWDAETGHIMHICFGQTGHVNSVAFNPDGKQIVSGGNDGTLTVWHTASGKELRTFRPNAGGERRNSVPNPDPVATAAFTADGQRIISVSQNGILTVCPATGKGIGETQETRPAELLTVEFNAGGARIAASGWDDTLNIRDATSGQEPTKRNEPAELWAGPRSAQAIFSLEKRLAILRRRDGDVSESALTTLSQLLQVHRDRGEPHAAHKALIEALSITAKLYGDKDALVENRRTQIEQSLLSIALTPQQLGLLGKARSLDRAASEPLATERRLGPSDPPDEKEKRQRAREFADAVTLATQASEIKRRILGEAHADYADSQFRLADLYWHLGNYTGDESNYARADPLFLQALQIKKQVLGAAHHDYDTSLHRVAEHYRSRGDSVRAEALYRQAMEGRDRRLVNMLRSRSEQEQFTQELVLRRELDEYLTVSLDVRAADAEVYRHVLGWKGAVHLQQFADRTSRGRAEFKPVYEDLQSVSVQLSNLARGADDDGRFRSDQLGMTAAALAERKEALERELAEKRAKLGPELSLPDLKPEDLQKMLPAKAALVDFLEYTHAIPPKYEGTYQVIEGKQERRLIAFVARRDRPIARVDVGPADTIRQHIDAWLTSYGESPGAVGAGRALKKVLWEPIENQLGDAKTVLVSPDGDLGRFPLGALPGKKEGSYLIEDLTLVVVPVPRLLSGAARTRPSEREQDTAVLVGDVAFDADPNGNPPASSEKTWQVASSRRSKARFGDLSFPPLPGTAAEIDEISAIHAQKFGPDHHKAIRGGDATEDAVRAASQQCTYLHLATHGFFEPVDAAKREREYRQWLVRYDAQVRQGLNPESWVENFFVSHPGLQCGLALAGANHKEAAGRPEALAKDDGILTALDVASLDLANVELVTLSACESGLGQAAGGEGALGLQRAFQIAGARNVVASLCKVDDEGTSALMRLFYHKLWVEGKPPAVAFREAQLWILNNPDRISDLAKARGAGLRTAVQRAALQLVSEGTPTQIHKRSGPYLWAGFVISGSVVPAAQGDALPNAKGKTAKTSATEGRRAESSHKSVTFGGASNSVTGAILSPDGTRIITDRADESSKVSINGSGERSLTPEQQSDDSQQRIKSDQSARSIAAGERTLAIMRRKGPEVSEAIAKIQCVLARLHEKREDWEAAKKAREEVLSIRSKLYGEKDGRVIEARRLLNNTMRMSALTSEQRGLAAKAESLVSQAMQFAQQGRPANGIPLASEALEIRRKVVGEAHPDFAMNLNVLATLYRRQGDDSRAETLYRQALEISKTVLGESDPNYAESLDNLAMFYYSHGDSIRAEPLYRQGLEIYEHQLANDLPLESERVQIVFTDKFRERLDKYLSLTLGLPRNATYVYRHVLALKGAVYMRQSSVRALRNRPELKPLFDEWESVSIRLSNLAMRSSRLEGVGAWTRQIQVLTERKEVIERELSNKSARFRKNQSSIDLNPDDLGNNLPANGALVDFLNYWHSIPARGESGPPRLERRIVAFVIRRARPIVRIDLGQSEPIRKNIDVWRESYGGTATAMEAAGALRQALWEPITQHLEGVERVYISPDGDLGRFPMGALPGKKGDGSYLLEDVDLVLVPVPRLLLASVRYRPAKREQNRAVFVGDVAFGANPHGITPGPQGKPLVVASSGRRAARFGDLYFPALPGTATEIEDIAALHVKQFGVAGHKTIRGTDATEDAVRSAAQHCAYLHLATHGFFEFVDKPVDERRDEQNRREQWARRLLDPRPQTPEEVVGVHPGLRSGLALAGANQKDAAGRPEELVKDDGILTALDVASLDLANVELVTLSACESGLGQAAGGEGVLGLQRAFHIAGARNVVASLCKVDDQGTAALMRLFYHKLWIEKKTPAIAFREAQQLILNNPDTIPDLAAARGAAMRTAVKLVSESAPSRSHKRSSPYLWAGFVISVSGG